MNIPLIRPYFLGGGGIGGGTLDSHDNNSHLKIDGWNTSFLLGLPIFRGYVSFRECSCWV